MKIVQVIAVIGIILFFPVSIKGATCFFEYFTSLLLATGNDSSTMMLDHYMRSFAIPWWTSIGLAAWSFKKLKKNKIHLEDNLNAK